MATQDIPSWGYSLRPSVIEISSKEYRYVRENIWEIERFDVQQTVRFGGQLEISYEGEI